MAWADLESRVNASVLRTLGESLSLVANAGSTTVTGLVQQTAEPLLIDGALSFSEYRHVGWVRAADVVAAPELGDHLMTDTATYRIDQPPMLVDGLYRLILMLEP